MVAAYTGWREGLSHLHGVFGIGLVPVKKVLQVNHDLFLRRLEVPDALPNHSQVFFPRYLISRGNETGW